MVVGNGFGPVVLFFFFSSRRRHTRYWRDWSSDVCSSDLLSPCVIFIDEIDALGRQRGRSNDSASADQDQTLNPLLLEMDGFDQHSGLVIIAPTNRPDILDSALTRPGRFGREVVVNLADANGREAIQKVHARGLKLEEGLDLR